LNQFVDYLWLVTQENTPRKERILPAGTLELLINLRDDRVRVYDHVGLEENGRRSGAVLSGTYSAPFAINSPRQHAVFGVHFKPGGAFPFLDAAASDLADSHVDLGDLWGPSAAELRERLCYATGAPERFSIAEQFLMERLRHGALRHPAVTAALSFFGPDGNGMSVRDVVARVGFSHRHFTRLFAEQVGLPPKLFCRILRFQRTLAVSQRSTISWGALAQECGYFDQSHMISDFRQFSGIAPGEISDAARPGLLANHLPILV
jgi:AraC-like DNA-binding protein